MPLARTSQIVHPGWVGRPTSLRLRRTEESADDLLGRAKGGKLDDLPPQPPDPITGDAIGGATSQATEGSADGQIQIHVDLCVRVGRQVEHDGAEEEGGAP